MDPHSIAPKKNHHHQSLNHEGHWGTTDDFATSFIHFSLFSTALWDLANSRPVHSLMLSSHLSFVHLAKNTSHGNKVQPQNTTYLIQRPCYQRGRPCQDPAGNRTTRRPPDDRKETQTVVLWSCFPFIRSGKNHLARHSERGKKTRQTEKGGGKTPSENGQAWSSLSPRGQWRTGENGEKVCKIICGTPKTLAVEGQMIIKLLQELIIIIITNPLTARVVRAPQMILKPVLSIFPCSPLPSGTCRTPGLSIP